MKPTLALLVALAIAPQAWAQDLPGLADLRSCATIPRDVARLACFDAVIKELGGGDAEAPAAAAAQGATQQAAEPQEAPAPPPAASLPPPAPRPLPTWRVVQERDQMTDQPEVTLYLEAENDRNAMMVLRCRRRRTEVLIAPQEYLGVGEGIEILMRIGDRPASTQRWNPSTTGRAVFAPNPIDLIRSLLGSEVLLVEIAPRHSGRISLRLPTRGLREAVAPLQAACGWR